MFQTNHNPTNQEKENLLVENIQYSRNQKNTREHYEGVWTNVVCVNGLGLTLHGSLCVK